jgi:predicted TIM-barrel fold metal-dependent hydrolase
MRIDAHVHYLPPELAQRLADFAEQEPFWGLLCSDAPGKVSVQGWATAEQMLADMDRAELDKVVLVGEYFQKHENCVARNDQALALVKRWPDRLVAFATLQPKAGAKAIDELKRCVDGGLRGVGELNPYAQGYRMTDPDFLRLVESCIEANLPLNLHSNEEVGPYYPGKSSLPLSYYYHLACRYPELKLILAHWGGGLFFYELMPKVRQALQNVWYDTAASPLLYPTGKIFNVALNCVDHRKILYGSDYPLRIYPRKQRRPDFHLFIDELKALNLPQAIYDDIMGNNMARLLGLAETGEAVENRLVQAGDGVEASTGPPPQGSTPSALDATIGSITMDKIDGSMAVSLVAESWPETRPLFEKFGISWQDSHTPFWEPIDQAAADQGWGPSDRQRLLVELNRIIFSVQGDNHE